jgi:hypothetical protein
VTVASATRITCTTSAHAAGAADVVVTNPDLQAATLAAGFTYVNPAPTLASISPTAGPIGGGTALTLNGTGFLAGATVSLSGSACTGVTRVSASQLTCTTTAHVAGAVDVTVTHPDAKAATLLAAFTYQGPPTVTSINPNSGLTTGGMSVTVSGSGFRAGVAVSVGGVPCGTVNLLSSTSLNCATGAHAAGTGDVVVTNSDAQSATLPASFTYVNPAPVLSGISPATGGVGGGTLLTLNGANFLPGPAISVGGSACTGVIYLSSSKATCTTPAHAAGAVAVTLTNSDGKSATLASAFTYVATTQPAPTVSAISPASGGTGGGTAVTVTGTNFQSGAKVSIGGTLCATTTFVSSTQLTCTTPAHAAGSVDVQVTNPDQQSATLTLGFLYANAPAGVTSVSPASGVSTGGALLTVNGSGFLAGVGVSVGGATCTGVTRLSSTQLTCTTPAHATGLVAVAVTNPFSSATTLANAFTYVNPAPTVSAVSPATGATAGGTTITVTGTGFLAGAAVSLGGSACASVNASSATSLSCATPAHAAGAVSVVVTNSDGRAGTLPNGFTYANPAPTLSSVSPNSGPGTGGTALTVNGTGFLAGATVSLGGAACTGVTLVSSAQLRCTTGAHAAGTVSVVVTNPDAKSATLANGFTYSLAATYTSIAQNIFQPRCVSCHGAQTASKGVDLSTYAKALGTGSIVPGNPAASTTYQDVANGSMPKGAGSSPLSAAEIKALNDWIAAGAPNN